MMSFVSYSNRPISVDLPSSTEPHVGNVGGWRPVRRAPWMGAYWPSEVPLPLLLLHRRSLVVIDEPAGALGRPRRDHLLDDVIQRRRSALDRGGQRIAAQRS